jgi:NADH oxidase (H2O2-forming)
MNIVIIGNGITGVTVARTVRKLRPDWTITLVSGESLSHWSRPALMYIYMGHMRLADTQPYEERFWTRNRIERVQGWVSAVDTARKQVSLADGRTLAYDKLVVASGSQPNRFGWPGQDLDRVSGMYSLQDLEAIEAGSSGLRQAVIVGGGLIGVELAEMFHSRGIHVVFLVREDSYWNNALPPEESALVGDVIRGEGIELRLRAELKEILGDETGGARAVVTRDGEEIPCQYVGLTAGVRPNLSAVEGSGIETERGILVDDLLATSAPDVYAAGDCAEIRRGEGERTLLQQVWYTGRLQGEALGRTLCGDATPYEPGIWFNSAKFFDLEWHTYGTVLPTPGPDERHLVWQDRGARRLVRLVFAGDGALLGMNALGIRYRHRVFERWIGEKRGMDYVLDHLGEATFDPEFSRRYERTIAASMRSQA